ncbi:hypothetical protein GJ496_000473 [Pomphorhynchus laevis]|nr:hypothetical protein GJ496_000473 [Pomphorhynchus laevis]
MYDTSAQFVMLCGLKLCTEMLSRTDEEKSVDFEQLSDILEQWQNLSLTYDYTSSHPNSSSYCDAEAAYLKLTSYAVKSDFDAESLFSRCMEYFNQPFAEKFKDKSQLKLPVLIAVIEVITNLPCRRPFLAPFVVRLFRDILIRPSPVLISMYTIVNQQSKVKFTLCHWSSNQRPNYSSDYSPFNNVRNSLIDGLCSAVRRCETFHDNELLKSLILALFARLTSLNLKSEDFFLVASNIVITLGQMAIQLADFKDTRTLILSSFQQHLTESKCQDVDVMIIDQLGAILINKPDFSQTDIIALLCSLILNGYDALVQDTKSKEHAFKARKSLSTAVAVFANIAKTIQSDALGKELLARLLDLFTNLAFRAKSKTGFDVKKLTSITRYIGVLGILLPIIASLLQRMLPLKQVNARLLKLFRSLWIYISFFSFGSNNRDIWPEKWIDNVQCIAVLSPAIVNREHLRNLEYNFPFSTKNVSKLEIQNLKLKVVTELGGVETKYIVDRMSYVQTAYLYAIYTLETLRAKHANCEDGFNMIFVYLEEITIQRDKSDIWKCLLLIATKCFHIYIDNLKLKKIDSKRDEYIINLAFILLGKSCSLYPPLSKSANSWLHTLMSKEKFPHLIWDYRIIQVLIDLTEILDRSLSIESVNEVCNIIKIRDTNIELLYHDSLTERSNLYQQMSTLCRNVISQALKFVPLLTKSHIQHFIFKKELWRIDVVHHPGLNIVLDMLNQVVKKENYGMERAQFNSLLNQRVFSVGFIDGMQETRAHVIEDRLIQELSFYSNGFSYKQDCFESTTPTSGVLNNVEVCKTLGKIAALLITREEIINSDFLLHLIAWAPAVIFSEESMLTAVNCWNWIYSAKKEFRIKLMSEISSAWEFTARQRKGLYERKADRCDPFAPDHNAEKSSHRYNFNPHKIWLQFLEEHLTVSLYNDVQIVNIFCSLFYNCLSYNEHSIKMNNHVSAVGIYFRILIMAFRIARSQPMCVLCNADILIERVVHCAFEYFSGHSEHPNQPLQTLKDDIEVLGHFFQYLSVEKQHIMSKLALITDETFTRSPSELLNLKKYKTYFHNPNNSVNIRNTTLRNLPKTESSRDIKSIAARLSISSDAVSLISNTSASKYRALLTPTNLVNNNSGEKRKDLLLLLIAAEMKRLKVHLNLMARVNVALQFRVYAIAESWYSEQINSATLAQIEEMTEIAWLESVDIASNLCSRLGKEAVDRKLSELISKNPMKAMNCASALRILNSYYQYASRMHNDPTILIWKNSNPVDALSYLFSNTNVYKSPMNVQFACQCLLKENMNTLMMYIPQIVQSLRRNELGYPVYLILSLSKRSDMLAHQFIWNIRANIWLGNHSGLDPISSLLELMIARIKDNFSERSRQFYEKENSFVEDIVDVSHKIKKFGKGVNRQLACTQEFERIQYRENCYLPTNPENVVVSVNYNSATPMQSAAKAPYRASFNVSSVGMEQIERSAKAGQHIKFDHSNLTQQMAIFKVGDDVRQDILALQLIRIFKFIFNIENLDLFLYPYNVVATHNERGVIECVRNAMSRDEIGRKVDGDMFHYFCTTYGDRDTAAFQRARQNFVKSMAGYSIALFLLQVKDRHNGNIMVDKDGHIIHIDFGFLFETSPGGNLGFEPDIKITDEMVLIMGGSVEASSFDWFKELCVKGYLSLRTYRKQICDLVTMMLDTKLPCFLGHAVEQLNMRFQPEMDDTQAADYILAVIYNCTRAIRTHLYDIFQYHQNQIPY